MLSFHHVLMEKLPSSLPQLIKNLNPTAFGSSLCCSSPTARLTSEIRHHVGESVLTVTLKKDVSYLDISWVSTVMSNTISLRCPGPCWAVSAWIEIFVAEKQITRWGSDYGTCWLSHPAGLKPTWGHFGHEWDLHAPHISTYSFLPFCPRKLVSTFISWPSCGLTQVFQDSDGRKETKLDLVFPENLPRAKGLTDVLIHASTMCQRRGLRHTTSSPLHLHCYKISSCCCHLHETSGEKAATVPVNTGITKGVFCLCLFFSLTHCGSVGAAQSLGTLTSGREGADQYVGDLS